MSKSKDKIMKPEFGKYPILISGGWNPLSTAAETFDTPFVEMHEIAESLSVQITNKTAEKDTSSQHISALGYLGCAKKVAESNESHFVPQSLNSLTTVGTPVPNVVHAMADSIGQYEYEGVMNYPKDPQVTAVRYLITAYARLHDLDPHEAWAFTESLVYDQNSDSYRLPYAFSHNGNFTALTTMHFQAIKKVFTGKKLTFDVNTGGNGLSTVDFLVPEYPIPQTNVTAQNVVGYFANLFPTGINNQGYALCGQILGHFPDNPDLIMRLVDDRVATRMTGHSVLVLSSVNISAMVGKIISGCAMTVRKYQQKLATRDLIKFDRNGSVAQMGRYSSDRSRCFSYEKMAPVDLCLIAMCNYQGETHWSTPRYESHEFNRSDILRQYAEHSRLNK